ncbi:hypothetical protein RchiOBHm_Chr3g0465611 [Rosa chinensis]|uniref:Uncharacterized protein n=1 Tax=Rosa chinensis TaxID=74649 RepID=A0A2P6R9T6_ROSCH|nr:hypothetical protein RchiOBHm_Chr3g0465611 [Rosa chinensis]
MESDFGSGGDDDGFYMLIVFSTEIKGPNSASAKSDKCKVLSLKKKPLSSKEGPGVIPSVRQESRRPSPRELKSVRGL